MSTEPTFHAFPKFSTLFLALHLEFIYLCYLLAIILSLISTSVKIR